jgi:hypothetical protein
MAVDRLGHYFGKYTTLHVAYSRVDCLDKLFSYGLSDVHLPVSFGGTWTGCQPWRTGVDSEHVLPPVDPDLPCLVRNALWSYSQTLSRGSSSSASFQGHHASLNDAGLSPQSTKRTDNKRSSFKADSGSGPDKPKNSAATMGNLTEEEKLKKRQKNQEYAQRKRGKEKIEIEVLQDQCLKLNRENALLCHEQNRLQQLVQTANGIVHSYENNNTSVAASRSSSSSLAYGAGSSGMFQLLSSQLPSLATSSYGLSQQDNTEKSALRIHSESPV